MLKTLNFSGLRLALQRVLHTWGQNLSFHPHVHCIVPGGGLSNDGLCLVQFPFSC
ncbi:transposase [Desulfosporosinus sp.]|uniref:transposase n=1 Tax=Desulfosporosinus sp. TaxID=157907 RepID=UPI00345BB137